MRAGALESMTSEKKDLNFQEPCHLLVEQGTDCIHIDLFDVRRRVVIAYLKLDPVQLLEDKVVKGSTLQKTFKMTEKTKGFLNPRIRLSFSLQNAEDLEKGILEDLDLGQETTMVLRSQMVKMADKLADKGQDISHLSKLEVACNVTSGPLTQLLPWGYKKRVWLRLKAPSKNQTRYWLEIYQDEQGVDQKAPEVQVDLMKVQAVQPDPGRDEVFIITYFDKRKVKQRLTFAHVDRPRSSWVDLLTTAIKLIREEKAAAQRNQ